MGLGLFITYLDPFFLFKLSNFCIKGFVGLYTKAELLLLKLIHLFAREVLLVKKLEIEETKTT
jgi:hypothetical protein